MNLTWDQWSDGIWVDMSGKFVKLRIPLEAEKGGQDRLYVVTPDFAELLRSVPEGERQGFVFNPILNRGVCRRTDTVSRAISAIGESAAVKVDERPPKERGGEPRVVWASAHDLRRAFGYRWSRRVNAITLRDLMRHSSVTTTEKYYVGLSMDDTAQMLQDCLPKAVAPPTGPSTGPGTNSADEATRETSKNTRKKHGAAGT